MRQLLQVLAISLFLATWAQPGHAQLERTKPEHYGSGVGGRTSLQRPGLPDFRTPDPSSRVLMRRRRDLKNIGPPDRRTTSACRRGRFRQVIDHRYVVVLNDKIYGAGIGGRAMLYDPRRIAKEGLIYLFVGQGTTNCRVYIVGTPNAG